MAPARRHRRKAALVVAVAAGAGVAALALSRLQVDRVLTTLSGVRPGWLGAALGLMAASLVLRAESWHSVLHAAIPEGRLARSVVMRASMIGVLTSTVAPGRLGEPSRAFVIARHLGEPRRYLAVVLGTVFSQTLLNLAALVVLAAATFAHAAFFRGHELALIWTLALPALAAAGVIGGPRLLRRAGRARWEPVRRLAGWLARELLQARQGLRVFKRGAEGARAAAAQFAAWALQWLACSATILALDLHPDQRLGAAAAVLLAVNVSAVLPPAPGNVGIFQGACIVVLAAYGIAAADALAYGILLQAVEIVTALALGVPALLAEGLSWRELRAGARSTLGP